MAIKYPKCHSDNPDTGRFCASCAALLASAAGSPTSPIETAQPPLVRELVSGLA